MTIKKISNVPQKDIRLGDEVLVKARSRALHLDGLVIKKWIRQIKDPSNSIPYSEASVIGENNDQTIFSDVLATMKREIPEPNPYPSLSIESNKITITPANINWLNIRMILTVPRVLGGP